MAKTNKRGNGQNKAKKNQRKKSEKYNADNEIIIGVTTATKEENQIAKRKKKKQKEKRQPVRGQAKNETQSARKPKAKKQTPQKPRKNGKSVYKNTLSVEQELKRSRRKKRMISVCVVCFILLGVGIYLTTTPLFRIANIEVEGNEVLSDETCISLSKIELDNTNIFAVTQNGIEKNLKENPYVESVTIKRKLPNTLQLEMKERKVAYQVAYQKDYLYLDEQGYVLEVGKEKKNVTKLKGLESTKEAIEVGKRVGDDDLKKLDTVLKIVNYCRYNLIKNAITEIDTSNISNYTIYFGKDGQVAYLGDASNLSERILNLKTILEKEKGNKGKIFVDGDLSQINGYFRPNEK